jgi:uncharacterized protein (TIGR00288 family)
MTTLADARNLALFCDFENIALGVREARYPELNVTLVIERLLVKGSIVVRKAYCDWDRYKDFKAGMHLAGFELIEIPHVKQSGKNSADIRMVVDALDLCYTKPHVDTFVIMSGDSDFSPLVAKLRENNKSVIGVGVKNSTSNLLTQSCDEFIYYDDLVREVTARKRPTKRVTRGKQPSRGGAAAAGSTEPTNGERTSGERVSGERASADRGAGSRDSVDPGSAEALSSEAISADSASGLLSADAKAQEKLQEAFDLVLATLEGLSSDRDDGKVWSSHVKQILKRRKPGFNESYYGFKSFNALLEEAAKRGLITLERDKSGSFIVRTVAD